MDRLPVSHDQPAGVGARGLRRHLLAQHRADGQFGLVDGARNALSGRLGDHRGQVGIAAECLDHRFGVGIEVQQPPAASDRGGEVPEVLEAEDTADVIVRRRQGDHAAARGKPQAASVRAVADLLATRYGTGGEMAEDTLIGERRPDRQPKRHRSGCARAGPEPGRRALAQRRRGAFEHQANGVVELPDAGKPRRERDVAERQLRRLDQHPCGLRSLRAGQRQRAGADLGLQEPLQLPGGIAKLAGKAADAVAVHRAVGDEPHCPRDDVATHVPFRRAGRCIGTASFARPEARPLSCGRGRVKPDVAREGRPHRAAGPTVDPGRQHRGDEPAVEPGVLGLNRPVAVVEILVHASTVTPIHRQDWRKSDIAVSGFARGARADG